MSAATRCDVLGAPVACVTLAQACEAAEHAIRERRRLLIGVVNAAKLVNMDSDSALRQAVLAADLILADGMSVVWAGRMLGGSIPERVAGIDLMEALLTAGDRAGHRFFLLGATPEVVQQVTAIVRERYPGARIAGAHHGYFAAAEEESLVARIRASEADILFAAMSSPKKEIFLHKYADALSVPVLHGVGGAFDVMAGKVRRAPGLWQRMGLEWLYRMIQEPRRLFARYFVTNTLFASRVARAWIRRCWFGTACPSPEAGGPAK